MKKIIGVIAIFTIAASCTERLPVPVQPDLTDQGICVLRAEMDDPGFVWDAVKSKIGIYSASGENMSWSIRSIYDGKTGEAEIFGREARGKVYAYYPYSAEGYTPCAEGRVNIPSAQKWFDTFDGHINGNTTCLVAAAEDGKLSFRQVCGCIHIRIAIDFPENIRRVVLSAEDFICGDYYIGSGQSQRLTDGGKSITVSGIDSPSSIASPLDVWFMLPPGTYKGLFVSVSGQNESVTSVLENTITVESGKQCDADAREQRHDYGAGDFEGEKVDFD